jgi:hypothetical protein
VWFVPTLDADPLSEPTWQVFSTVHEEDAYVMVDWQAAIEDQLSLGLPDWASSEVCSKTISSLRFGRPQAAGPMCHSWVPVRTVGRMVRAILGLGAASARLPTAELIRFVLLVELTEGGEKIRPLELLKLPGPVTGSYLVFARAMQSAIRHKVLLPNGALINTRPAQNPAGGKGSRKK